MIHETPRPDASPGPLGKSGANLHLADQRVVTGHELDAWVVLGRRGVGSTGASTGVTGPLTTTAPDPIASTHARCAGWSSKAAAVTDAEIAAELIVGEATVKSHVAHVLMKLDLRDRIQAVILAYELRIV